MSQSRILVWDLPTRLFHWLLTVGLIACLTFAQFADEHSSWFMIHMILGIVLGAMVAMRLVWGVVGSRYARFSSFLFSPSKVLSYIQGAFSAKGHPYVGHNPGSSYAIFAMLILLGTAVVTGLMMSNGSKFAEELHAASSYALVAVVAVHVLGVVWYSRRHHENITMSMITGTKIGKSTDAIPSNRPFAALVFLALVGSLTLSLFQNFDRIKGQTKLPLVNTVIQLSDLESSRDPDE